MLLAGDYPGQPAVLVLCDDRLWLSRDSGATWAALPGVGITAVSAPEGLVAGAHLLLGLLDGRVVRTPI